MPHEQRTGHEPYPINAKDLVEYAEECFGARVDVANYKYQSVSLLGDLDSIVTKYPTDFMDDDHVIDSDNPIQSIVALIVESDNLAYAVIRIDNDNLDGLNTPEVEYNIVKIGGKEQAGDVVNLGELYSPRIENGALIVRPQGNYAQSFVYTNPRPNTQTSDKEQYHILAGSKSAKSKEYEENRNTFLIKGSFGEDDLELGAPSEAMALAHANILRKYGLWVSTT